MLFCFTIFHRSPLHRTDSLFMPNAELTNPGTTMDVFFGLNLFTYFSFSKVSKDVLNVKKSVLETDHRHGSTEDRICRLEVGRTFE